MTRGRRGAAVVIRAYVAWRPGGSREHMRALFRIIGALIALVLIVALAAFAVQNTQDVNGVWFGLRYTASLWWIAIGAAVLGFVLGVLLFAPGRVAAGWRGRTYRRTADQRERDLAALRTEHQQVQAEHERVLAEHRRVVAERDQLRRSAMPAPGPINQPPTMTQPAAPPPDERSPRDETASPPGPTRAQPRQVERDQEEWMPNAPAAPA